MSGALTEAFTYNALGQLTADSRGAYTYTPAGRLATVTGPVTAGYGYDGDELRWTRTVNGHTVYTVRGAGQQVLSEYQSACAGLVWGRDLLYAGGRLIGAVRAVTTQPSAAFTAGTASASEGVTPATLEVSLTLPPQTTLTCAVTVSYAVRAESAGAEDATLTEGTVTFTPGGLLTQDIPVAITPDTIDEADETLTVTLTSAIGATVGSLATATLTILDDDPLPTVSVASRQIAEPAGPVVVTATLAGATSREVQVSYSTTAGSASASDFTPQAGTLTFPAGTTAQTVTLPVTNDTTEEFVEQFTLTLSAPVHAALGTATATVSILDDDRNEPTSGQQGADFTGDGLADPAVFNSLTGYWTIKDSATGTITTTSYGMAADIPVVGDYDGNGTADRAVFRPATSTWYATSPGFSTTVFGQPGDVPVPADYDGDGRTDLAVFRPATGVWEVQRSTAGPLTLEWGVFGDVPVPADYDGNGSADLAVWRPWTGTWYVLGATPIEWGSGLLGDVPLPGDYDADGIDDLAVYRRHSGIWYLAQSGAGVKTLAWGQGLTDYPAPGNFVAAAPGLELTVYRPTGGLWYVHTGSGYVVVPLGGQAGDIPALRRK